MKKIISIISIISIVLWGMTLAPVSNASTITVGNDINDRLYVDTYQNFTIIDTNNPALVKAELQSFEFYAKNSNPFRFVIVDDTNEVKWISDEITPTNTPGENTYEPTDSVFIGVDWNIGLYFSLSGTVPFEYNGAADPAFYEKNNAGLPVIGEILSYLDSSNRIYSFVAYGVTLPYGEIISPEADEVVFGSVNLEAKYIDGDELNDDIVQWAVRKGTCAAGVGTVWGNVDGKSDSFSWDGKNFSAAIDTSGNEPGSYCFVFNPKDDAGENDVRETREFYIGDLSISPEEAYNIVGTEHTVTADIGVPLEGNELLFVVEGINPTTDIVITDGLGQAEFTYIGDSAGADTITVCVDIDGEGDCDIDEPLAVATKYWSDEYVSGGGQIIEEEEGAKQKDWKKISFGGAVFEYDGLYFGEWEVNFHNAEVNGLNKSKFHTSSILDINFFSSTGEATCNDAVNFEALGEWNGTPGYKLIFRVGDALSPGHFTKDAFDTVRVELYDPDGVEVYDTYPNEFTHESSCFGGARTGLDNGNLTISNP